MSRAQHCGTVAQQLKTAVHEPNPQSSSRLEASASLSIFVFTAYALVAPNIAATCEITCRRVYSNTHTRPPPTHKKTIDDGWPESG